LLILNLLIMNKKFSTLVAALLVSGVSYAVVDTFNSYAMTNSPVAKAATANVTRAVANYSVNALKASEATLIADNVLWNVSGAAGSYVFKTKAGSVLGKDANGIILRNSNLPVEGAADLEFAWTDNHLTTDEGANVLVISKAQDEIKLVPVADVDLVNYTYATLF
ncbi:MAG: hypothetical protein LUD46_01700, partial [Parabacteroides sp.]|nr:hypothetical protein [Parabacteroides sp.]